MRTHDRFTSRDLYHWVATATLTLVTEMSFGKVPTILMSCLQNITFVLSKFKGEMKLKICDQTFYEFRI